MTLRDVAMEVRRQEPGLAQHAIWAERAKLLRTDRLTGLRNRLGWGEALDEAKFAAARFGTPLVVARIDLDGAPHGPRSSTDGETTAATTGEVAASSQPQPVVSFAGRARGVVRNGDLFARLDGSVLVVALSRCPAAMAVRVLERIRASVEDGTTCSVGWALWDGHESSAVLMDRAGQALSLAQERGGDQIATL